MSYNGISDITKEVLGVKNKSWHAFWSNVLTILKLALNLAAISLDLD